MNFGGSKGRRIPGFPLKNGRNDRDNEELHLFRELHKREKERTASLLLPVSDEFEPSSNSGNYPFYKIASSRKGSGIEFLADNNNKHDYDWLKTPPATPLFPSLEMEAGAPEIVVQREIPITNFQPPSQTQPKPQPQPQSTKPTNYEASKASNGRPKSPTIKPKVPLRSVTPSRRPTILSVESKQPKANPSPTLSQFKMTQPALTNLTNKRTNTTINNPIKPTNQKDIHKELLTLNLSKSISMATDSKPNTKPRSRATSPIVRSTIAAQIPEFSNETPPNLRTTERATSATRGRPVGVNHAVSATQKAEPITKTRRQSCSPSVTRGRKVETKPENDNEAITQKRRGQFAGNGTHVLGSRMVEKVMNARKPVNNEEKDTKPRQNSGIVRLMLNGSVSVDKSLRHTVHRR